MQKKGFTLIELIIVLLVTAILAMFSISMYQNYLEQARNAAAQSLLRNFALAQVTHKIIYDFFITDLDDVPAVPPGAGSIGSPARDGIGALIPFGFRPDPKVGMRVQRLGAAHLRPMGYTAFAVHNSKGSSLYVYDFATASGVIPAIKGTVYGGGNTPSIYSSYVYDGAGAIVKMYGGIKVAAETGEPYLVIETGK